MEVKIVVTISLALIYLSFLSSPLFVRRREKRKQRKKIEVKISYETK